MAFSDLALAQLLKAAPSLSPSIISFKDMTGELEASTKDGQNIGVFILSTGKEPFFIPILGKQDTILPPESMFLPSLKSFFPLSEKGVDFLATTTGPIIGQSKEMPTTIDKNPSVEALVNPPRTGKYVYSSARFIELLASLSPAAKAEFRKLIEDREIGEPLSKIEDMDHIRKALEYVPENTLSTNAETPSRPYIMLTQASVDIPLQMRTQVIKDGFAFLPTDPLPPLARFVIEEGTQNNFSQLSFVDVGEAYKIVLKNGDVRLGFCPRREKGGSHGSFVILENGDFGFGNNFVTTGEREPLEQLFEQNDHLVPFSDLTGVGRVFALLEPSKRTLVGVYTLLSPPTKSDSGYHLSAIDYLTGDKVEVYALKNRGHIIGVDTAGTVLVPESMPVLLLGQDISDSIETSVEAAKQRLQFSNYKNLDERIALGFDGYSYWLNGFQQHDRVKMAEELVFEYGLSPEDTSYFIKKAEDQGRVVLMTKSAEQSFPVGKIPYWGRPPTPQDDQKTSPLYAQRVPKRLGRVDADGRLVPPLMLKLNRADGLATKRALDLGDREAVEATIMSQLLRAEPIETIRDYLPDIASVIDRLGRTLFVLRLNTGRLIKDRASNDVGDLLDKLRTVYKNLGDIYLDLLFMAS